MKKGQNSLIGLALGLSAVAAFAPTPAATPSSTSSQVGITGKGGGAYIQSEDGHAIFRLMGYAQPTFIATAESNKQPYKVPSFYVRRARADFKAEYDSLYTLFFEFDGGTATGASLVEGYTQATLLRDALTFRLGKYIQPFSAENLRSSRALETVERFQALSAYIGLPALDAQTGVMLFGTDPGKMFKYYLSINNGINTAKEGGNVKDNNSDKDYIGRIEVSPTKTIKVGLGLDYDKELNQGLVLKTYSGASFDSINVHGTRLGVDVDLHAVIGKFGLDAEWLYADFSDTNATLHGGYLQASSWVKGSEVEGGFEPLVRVEYSTITAKNPPGGAATAKEIDGAMLMSGTLGVNYWMNQWVRWQVDAIEETTKGKGNGRYAGVSDGDFLPTLLAELQIKF